MYAPLLNKTGLSSRFRGYWWYCFILFMRSGQLGKQRPLKDYIGGVIGSVVIASIPTYIVGDWVKEHNVMICEQATGKACSSTGPLGNDAATYRGEIWLLFTVIFTGVWLRMSKE